jgi:hypothetical protein
MFEGRNESGTGVVGRPEENPVQKTKQEEAADDGDGKTGNGILWLNGGCPTTPNTETIAIRFAVERFGSRFDGSPNKL